MSFTEHKAQVSFEFIVVLSAVLFLSASIMMDFFNESNVTLIAAQTKNLLESEIAVMAITEPGCRFTYLKSFNVSGNAFFAQVRGPCNVEDDKICKKVEQTICNFQGNENNIIECGSFNYVLKVLWKEKD